jgi:hypothetical protein
MKTVLFVLLLGVPLGAAAGCPVKRPGDLPVLPDGASATAQEMLRAQLTVENYLLQAEAYLACSVMNRRQHDALSVRLDVLSESYGEELIEYQVRTQMVAEK